MRKGVVLFLIFMMATSFHDDKSGIVRWVISNGCSLKVDGSTNVNTFSCAISNYGHPDTITVARQKRIPLGMSGYIMLDVNNFDCHNQVMTADLRKTLKSKDFPKIIIRFISIDMYPEAGTSHTSTKGIVMIQIAGVTRKMEVNYKVVSAEKKLINLVGYQAILFSDFDISPPKKLGGMIKTNNKLKVEFDLKLKVLE